MSAETNQGNTVYLDLVTGYPRGCVLVVLCFFALFCFEYTYTDIDMDTASTIQV